MNDPKDLGEAVFSITLYAKDPYCLEYGFNVESQYDSDDPRHLEQLTVLHEIIDNTIATAEKAVIHKALLADRRLRKAQQQISERVVTDGVMN